VGLRLDLASTFDKEALGDPVFRRLYLAGDKAFGWDPADPRLTELAALMADWSGNNPHAGGETELADGPISRHGNDGVRSAWLLLR
jgi:hypothetical protein